MIKNRIGLSIASIALLITIALTPQRASALLLELALVIDGSSSISSTDWGVQIGAYQNIFTNGKTINGTGFYTDFIAPSQFDQIAVAAYIFSGGYTETFTDGSGNVISTNDVIVYSFLDWTLITDNSTAANFGAQFAGLPQPNGTTHTSGALDIAANGLNAANLGVIGCTDSTRCSPPAPLAPPFSFTATGLLDNSYTGDKLVIDISTDGVPTEPNGGGSANQQDRDLAFAVADAARANGITINALGVGGVDLAFLNALVDDTVGSLDGFVEVAPTFVQFQTALETKIGKETVIPIPPALWLFGSGLLGLAGMARRRKS
ncbi:MAG: DUF1194 domain-containing protein [Gammaproteobacteria bacterium]